MTETAKTLECGCVIYFDLVPCAEHNATLASGDEHLSVTLAFEDRYSSWPLNKHKVNLERVQRIHRGLDDEPMEFSSATVADMLQEMADAEPTANAAFVLQALANALRGEDSHHRLTLQQAKRGKWQSPAERRARHRQHCAWILRLWRLQRDGWPIDAAIHRIAETTGNSVSRVYAGIAEERSWQAMLTAFPRFHSEADKLKRPAPPATPNSEF